MKVLAIDFGEKRIGLAISDFRGIIAEPYKVILRTSDKSAILEILNVISDESVEEIIVGVPLDNEGKASSRMAQRAINFKEKLEKRTNIPVSNYDETLSSSLVVNKKGFIDDRAAAHFLQSYLDFEAKKKES